MTCQPLGSSTFLRSCAIYRAKTVSLIKSMINRAATYILHWGCYENVSISAFLMRESASITLLRVSSGGTIVSRLRMK
jgi:hypothetical protein